MHGTKNVKKDDNCLAADEGCMQNIPGSCNYKFTCYTNLCSEWI